MPRAVSRVPSLTLGNGNGSNSSANDNDAVEVDRLQEGTHGVHGSPVGGVLVTEAHPVAAGDGCSLRDAHQFKGKVAVRLIVANRQGR